MITLCMDSAYKNLVIGLYRDDKLIDGIAFEAFKKQSETIFVELEKLLKQNNIDYKDIDRIVITDGPGSYTGIRIAMTIAKVLSTQMGQELCCISTMQLYAGAKGKANVILDARSKRAYVAHLEDGKILKEPCVLEVDQIPRFLEENPGTLYGDGYLIGQESAQSDFLDNFIKLKDQYRVIENKHTLAPKYLKESDAYKA
ncbi:universal bacterial protein YeaZ [Firmicutes bacterium M10-2]|nr:universal bacterial protein YeaZ [Firmicutes bacterium M10-2]